ncbi:MAG: hypothetical protein JWM14_2477 [Chitinophagaceae bacterium]|nr:hypothetical protein [Chitinophagaceae bacterium]
MTRLIKTIFFVLSFSFLSSCVEKSPSDPLTAKENTTTSPDTTLTKQVLWFRTKLIERFNDSIPNGIDSNYYYLIFSSSFGNGTTVKFTRKEDTYFLCVKTLTPNDSINRLTQYTTEIDKREWYQLENMVDEFDFWSATHFKYNRVLDGDTYFLEGSRISNNMKLHQLVGRGSPRYDKIGALCDYIMKYQEHLVFQYKQVHK